MRSGLLIRGIALMSMLLATGCATPPAQVSTVSARHPQYDRVVKRVVVVLGSFGVLDTRAVRSQLVEHLKANDVNALVIEHHPQLVRDPIAANLPAVRALRPHAILFFQARHWAGSYQHNFQSSFVASLTVPGGRSVWDATFRLRGIEQAESILVGELMKKLIEDRIIDKDAVVPDDAPGARQI